MIPAYISSNWRVARSDLDCAKPQVAFPVQEPLKPDLGSFWSLPFMPRAPAMAPECGLAAPGPADLSRTIVRPGLASSQTQLCSSSLPGMAVTTRWRDDL